MTDERHALSMHKLELQLLKSSILAVPYEMENVYQAGSI